MRPTKYIIFIMDLTDSEDTHFSNWQVDNMSFEVFDTTDELHQVVYHHLILGNLVETKKIIGDFSNTNVVDVYVDGFLRSKGLR